MVDLTKNVRQLLEDLQFMREDYRDLIFDLVYDKLIQVRGVYSHVGLIPEQSNMAGVLDKSQEPERMLLERLVQMVKGVISCKPRLPQLACFEYDWARFIDHLPEKVCDSSTYLSFPVPESLKAITQKSLNPLMMQLNRDRQTLLNGDYLPEGKSLRQVLNEYVTMPTVALFYFLSFGEIPEIVQIDNRARNIHAAFLNLQKQLKMMFTDAMVLQYFEDFEDRKSMNYRLKVENKLRIARIFRGIDTEEEVLGYLM